MSFRRIIWIVLDSVGIGAMPDAADYGDVGSDTLGNIAKAKGLVLPNLSRMGLTKIRNIPGLCRVDPAAAAYGKCALASPGKDTTTGHWEMAGIILEKPFPVYPHGFPPEIINALARPVLGNKAASGTEIIQELGEEHMRTGAPIVYTSADSVFQIAAHEDVMPLAELYQFCEKARAILQGPHEVGRVIARPFTGQPGAFKRTANRHDYAVPPPAGMLLDQLHDKNVFVYAIGKIADIFLGRGISHSVKTKSNEDGMAQTVEAMRVQPDGLIFVNLVDFDSLYGHRNDPEGYARALEAVDRWLPNLDLQPGDALIVTADHGCDPTTPSTDHSREYTPLLVYGQNVRPDVALGTRASLADIGATVAENFGTTLKAGKSFLHDIQTL
jgi:phosphopentomutase